jgi:hypothetical protein
LCTKALLYIVTIILIEYTYHLTNKSQEDPLKFAINQFQQSLIAPVIMADVEAALEEALGLRAYSNSARGIILTESDIEELNKIALSLIKRHKLGSPSL